MSDDSSTEITALRSIIDELKKELAIKDEQIKLLSIKPEILIANDTEDKT